MTFNNTHTQGTKDMVNITDATRISSDGTDTISTVVEMLNGKHEVTVILREDTYLAPVTVVVRNASSKCWNKNISPGRNFNSVDEALAKYKTAAIKDCIFTAAYLSRSPELIKVDAI